MKQPDLLRLEALRLATSIAAQKFRTIDTATHGQITETEYSRSADDVLKDAAKMLKFLNGK